MKTHIFILIFPLLACCNTSEIDETSTNKESGKDSIRNPVSSSINNIDSIDIIKKNAFERGDSLAYEKLEIYYLDYSPEVFLQYADSFANKFNYSKAHFDVYRYIKFIYGIESDDLKGINFESKDFSLIKKHLKAAASQGDKEAQLILTINKTSLGNSFDASK